VLSVRKALLPPQRSLRWPPRRHAYIPFECGSASSPTDSDLPPDRRQCARSLTTVDHRALRDRWLSSQATRRSMTQSTLLSSIRTLAKISIFWEPPTADAARRLRRSATETAARWPIWRRRATVRMCLLSSGSRGRILPGALILRRVTPGGKRLPVPDATPLSTRSSRRLHPARRSWWPRWAIANTRKPRCNSARSARPWVGRHRDMPCPWQAALVYRPRPTS
jgi:hypothetical protein